MAINLTLTTSGIADGEIIYAANHTTPLGQIETYLENILNGAQSAEAFRFDELGSNPSTPSTGKWKLYAKSTGLYIIDDGGTVTGPLGSGGGGVSDHGALTGLSDDDHTQYLPVNGSRAMSASMILPELSTPTTPGSGYAKVYAKADGKLYMLNDGGTEYDLTAGAGSAGDYIHIEEQQTSGTSAGTFTSGAWQTRVLNTEVTDTGSDASIASNQITLAAGTYRARIMCPAYGVGYHQARLQNVTDGTTALTGQSGYTNTTNQQVGYSSIFGQFTIASTKVFEVQHRCATTRSTNGFGIAASLGTEVYTVVELTKVA